MKTLKTFILISFCIFLIYKATPLIARQLVEGYILEHEADLAKEEPGTHQGGGLTTGYHFFKDAKDLKLVFKKRILKPGSGIGYHLQKEDEIYYILDGEGEMQINGKIFSIKAGDAVLTRPGSSHGLKNLSHKDLTIMINYEKH